MKRTPPSGGDFRGAWLLPGRMAGVSSFRLEASKAAGLAAIARDGNIPREAVLALGDGYNDVSMLSWAGLGIAMAHGHESARSAARQVSPPGDAGTALARALSGIFVNPPGNSGAK